MCYGKDHLAVEYTLPARELELVISNFEALNEAKRSRMPATMYPKAKRFVTNDMSPADKTPAALYAETHPVIQARGPDARNSAMNKPIVPGN